ncbi:hypothetical protein GW931_01575 [archaeon]|nr:hypothetical protein [archaeon]
MNRKRRFFGKKGIVSEYLPWILISLAILTVLMISIFFLKGKGISVLDGLKGIFRGG